MLQIIKCFMIKLENITKSFADGTRTRTVLDGVNLTVEDGEFIAITGESGAGKTTLLSILGTLLKADSGSYIINNEDVANADLPNLRNKQIGVVFQDHRLLPQFSALQNILLPLLADHKDCPKEAEKRAEELMQFMGISDLKDQSVTVLSGGEKTRVAICRALINNPAILLADEPTGQLDSDNSQTIAALFKKVNVELKTTIIMVTHSDAMAKVANKTYNLNNGKLNLVVE